MSEPLDELVRMATPSADWAAFPVAERGKPMAAVVRAAVEGAIRCLLENEVIETSDERIAAAWERGISVGAQDNGDRTGA